MRLALSTGSSRTGDLASQALIEDDQRSDSQSSSPTGSNGSA